MRAGIGWTGLGRLRRRWGGRRRGGRGRFVEETSCVLRPRLRGAYEAVARIVWLGFSAPGTLNATQPRLSGRRTMINRMVCACFVMALVAGLTAGAAAETLAVSSLSNGRPWSDPLGWSPGIVPNNGPDRSFAVTSYFGADVDIDVTIDSWTAVVGEEYTDRDFYVYHLNDPSPHDLTINTSLVFGAVGREGHLLVASGHLITGPTSIVEIHGAFTSEDVVINNGTIIDAWALSGRTGHPDLFINNGTIIGTDSLEISDLTNHGLIEAKTGSLVIYQMPQFSGAYQLDAGASLTFELPDFPSEEEDLYDLHPVYDFSVAGTTLTGDGRLVISPNVTVVLPADTAFAGDIEINGTLVIAPPMDPANAGITPAFTVLDPAPEPGTVGVMALAPLLLRRRKNRRA